MWRELLAQTVDDADVVVFGIPYDGNCSVGRGAAMAPSVIRELSEHLPPFTIDGSKVSPLLFDLGDVLSYDYDSVLEKMNVGKDKKLTLMLGGDHSVSILTQRAYREINKGKRAIIHNGFSPEDITMIGIRSYEEQELDFLGRSKVSVFSSEDVIADVDAVADAVIAKYADYEGVYLSFDIDAVDPAYAPATGTPEAFGLPSLTALRIVKRLISSLPVDAMDIVEVSPPLDVNNITSWLALKFLIEILNLINKR